MQVNGKKSTKRANVVLLLLLESLEGTVGWLGSSTQPNYNITGKQIEWSRVDRYAEGKMGCGGRKKHVSNYCLKVCVLDDDDDDGESKKKCTSNKDII